MTNTYTHTHLCFGEYCGTWCPQKVGSRTTHTKTPDAQVSNKMTWDSWPFESARFHIHRYGGHPAPALGSSGYRQCKWGGARELAQLWLLHGVWLSQPANNTLPANCFLLSLSLLSRKAAIHRSSIAFSCSTPQISSLLLRSEIKRCFKILRRPKDLTKETDHWSLTMTNPCRFIFFLPKCHAFGLGRGRGVGMVTLFS